MSVANIIKKSEAEKAKKTWSDVLSDTTSIYECMQKIEFFVSYFRDPEGTITKYNLQSEAMEQYLKRQYKRLINIVAKETGADPAQIADENSRTDEQENALFEALIREQFARTNSYISSNWAQALTALSDMQIKSAGGVQAKRIKEPMYIDGGDTYSVPELSALYFFAKHPEIKPFDKADLTDKDIVTLKNYCRHIDDFCDENKIDDQEILSNFFEQEWLEVPSIVESIRIENVDFPIDKINKKVWKLFESDSAGGQIAIHTEKHGSKDPVIVLYAISFDELENQGITITKKLTAFEKRIYIAAGALYAIKGQKPFTYTELYYAMGYTGNPGKNDLEKLAAAITKMGGAQIYVDNQQEIAAKYNYPRFRYDGYLLPMERVTAIVDGKITDAAIHLFREPPLIAFARQRKQITQINIKLLQSPASKTEANIALEDYLIERIAYARNERRKLEKKRCKTDEERRKKAEALDKDPRILFATLYEHADITTVKQKQRAPEKVRRILEHYKACSFIRDFEIDATGVTITL